MLAGSKPRVHTSPATPGAPCVQQMPQWCCGVKRDYLQAQACLQLSSTRAGARSPQQRWWVSRASHMVSHSCPCSDNQDQLKILGWRSVINPHFCKELGELILPLTTIWSDIKLECICHCKEFVLLFDICCFSSATPLVSNSLKKNWEFTGWYKTLQWEIFTYHSLGSRQETETAQIVSRNVDNTIHFFSSQAEYDFPLILFSFGLPKT